MKQVRETAAGKTINAYIILNKKQKHVATVQIAYLDSGSVWVDVWNHFDSKTKMNGPQQARASGGATTSSPMP